MHHELIRNQQRIINYLLKSRNLRVEELAVLCGWGPYRSTLRRYTDGNHIIGTEAVKRFYQAFGVKPEAWETGIIDNMPADNDDYILKNKFGLKQKYRDNRLSSGAISFINLRACEAALGIRACDEICQELKVDNSYFVNINNRINMSFGLDFCLKMLQRKPHASVEIKKLMMIWSAHPTVQKMNVNILDKSDKMNKAQNLLETIDLYELNNIYEVLDANAQHLIFRQSLNTDIFPRRQKIYNEFHSVKEYLYWQTARIAAVAGTEFYFWTRNIQLTPEEFLKYPIKTRRDECIAVLH